MTFNFNINITQDDECTEAIVGAINNLSDNLGKWLSVIADAISNRDADAVTEAALTEKLKGASDPLKAAVESQSQP